MNTKDYISLLNKPYSLNERQTPELESILSEFPYLQSARAIHLKGLYNQDSFRYNTELKKTAAFTTDRSVLFDFITSENFQSIDKLHFEEAKKAVTEIPVKGSEEVKPPVNKLEESIKQTVEEAETTEKPTLSQKEAIQESEIAEKLEIGKPIAFTKNETHSFSEWLQLAQLKPVIREETPKEPEKESGLEKKLDIIDRFIEANPKITPAKNATSSPIPHSNNHSNNSSLMTETLARVYLEQKKYTKAIQAYEILILKYPEKSVFFADRIADIKILQQNNN
ncbi:hypothetical protein E0W68_01215 [Flavobacterium salilacus subsp. salilacus]|uniref:tetratricopeptide repeat protein n=1 Tax=Flavobacterium TaxID=237 RepID=UPI0010756B35|nr:MULTISPECIES: tetratricopeptide repeat protein [Flavobacterium]KAF2519877.1 hypothetical protein E0W68_01215 [Flavobacterium salilacus subsp. salilacus]MBE1614217.1 hypothetical protein [Flavobacterium sp. SaA2.13]